MKSNTNSKKKKFISMKDMAKISGGVLLVYVILLFSAIGIMYSMKNSDNKIEQPILEEKKTETTEKIILKENLDKTLDVKSNIKNHYIEPIENDRVIGKLSGKLYIYQNGQYLTNLNENIYISDEFNNVKEFGSKNTIKDRDWYEFKDKLYRFSNDMISIYEIRDVETDNILLLTDPNQEEVITKTGKKLIKIDNYTYYDIRPDNTMYQIPFSFILIYFGDKGTVQDKAGFLYDEKFWILNDYNYYEEYQPY